MKFATASLLVHLVSLAGLAACTREEPARSVSWYREHAEDRKAMIARCSDDPAHLAQAPDCINARRAEGQESIGHWKDLPPLGLPLPENARDPDEEGLRLRP